MVDLHLEQGRPMMHLLATRRLQNQLAGDQILDLFAIPTPEDHQACREIDDEIEPWLDAALVKSKLYTMPLDVAAYAEIIA